MPTTITPVDVFTTAITVPTDGEVANGTSLSPQAQALANRSENNFVRLNAIPAVNDSTVFVDIFKGQNTTANNSIIGWRASMSGVINADPVTATSAFLVGFAELQPPAGSTITAVALRVDASGHSSLPGSMPVMRFFHHDPFSNATTVVQSLTDPSASVGAYETPHALVMTPAHVVVANRLYGVEFTGEGGANVIDGQLTITSIDLTWTL